MRGMSEEVTVPKTGETSSGKVVKAAKVAKPKVNSPAPKPTPDPTPAPSPVPTPATPTPYEEDFLDRTFDIFGWKRN